MKNTTITTITVAAAAGLSAAILGLAAPAVAAPSAGNANDTVAQLENQGNRVIINRQSSAPLSEAHVIDVRQGNAIQEYVWDAQGDRKILQTTGHVVFVDVR